MKEGLVLYYGVGIFCVFTAFFLSARFSLKFPLKRLLLIFFIFGAFFSLWMLIAQYLKYLNLRTYVDFYTWPNLFYNVNRTGKPLSLTTELLVRGTRNYFSVHFVPLVYILSIPFKFFPYNETVILLNYSLMTSSVIPLYKLARYSETSAVFTLFVSLMLLSYPTFQYIGMYEFDMLRFSIPVLLWMIFFHEKKMHAWYVVSVICAILVREELGLTVMMFGIFLGLIKKEFFKGGLTAFVGLCSFLVIAQVIMPALRAPGGYTHIASGSFKSMGSSLADILAFPFYHPGAFLSKILQPEKLANAGMLFIPLLGIPLFSPSLLIPLAANLGVGLVSDSLVHISYMLYYISPSVPFIFYAFIKSWPRIVSLGKRFIWKTLDRKEVSVRLMQSVMMSALVANVFFGGSPISLQFWFKDLKPAPFRTQNFHYSAYKLTGQDKRLEYFVDLIPESSIVSTQQFITPRLYRKRGVMMFPVVERKGGDFQADFILFDVSNNGLAEESPAYVLPEYFEAIQKDAWQWRLIETDGTFFLFQRIRSQGA